MPAAPPGRIIVDFVRHTEARNNVSGKRYGIDPPLTNKGYLQCKDILKNTELPRIKYDQILCSPLLRTLDTACYALKPGTKVIVHPDLRELGTGPSSTGSKVDDIKKMFAKTKFDFSKVNAGWETNKEARETRDKNGRRVAWSRDQLARAGRVKKEIFELAEKRSDKTKDFRVLCISHGDFLRVLTSSRQPIFWNGEGRSFELYQHTQQQDGHGKRKGDKTLRLRLRRYMDLL